MKILLCHNFYQRYGGEDQIFHTEANLLETHGHEVLRYTVHNQEVTAMNLLNLSKATVWNQKVYKELRHLLGREKPHLVHCHNTFPLISPAAYYAAHAEGVPVVQNLQNYRLLCPNAQFLRAGRVCEDCLKQFVPWPGVVHACYRHNRAATAVVATMLTVHRVRRTWQKMVDMYLVPTEFARQKFIQGGLPPTKIFIKPNFVYPDPGVGQGQGGYALFVGRLSSEKGLDTLLTAWSNLNSKIGLKIVGDGPLAQQVTTAAQRLPDVEWLGQLSQQQVLALMKEACFLLFPSIWYEGLPLVIIEAYAVGLPVIASNLGAMSSMINPGRTGLHFQVGNPEDLITQVEWLLTYPTQLSSMRQAARREFEANYSADRAYKRLIDLYNLAGQHK
jgi:glycosyltransferase involved in cell wall biosynthesis